MKNKKLTLLLNFILVLFIGILIIYPLFSLTITWNENPSFFGEPIRNYYSNNFGSYLENRWIPVIGLFFGNLFNVLGSIVLPISVASILILILNNQDKVNKKS